MNHSNDRSADEKALQSLFQELQAAWDRGDGEAFASYFTDDADYIIVNGIYLQGRQAVADTHQHIFATLYRDSRLEGFVKNIRFLSDDIALLHLHGRPRIPGQALPAPEQHSIQTIVAIKQAGSWRATSFQNTLIQQQSPS